MSKSLAASPTAIGLGSSHPPPAQPPSSIRSPFTIKQSSQLTSIRHPLGRNGRGLQMQAPGPSLQPPRNVPFIEINSRKKSAHRSSAKDLSTRPRHHPLATIVRQSDLRRLDRHHQPFGLPAPCGPSRSNRSNGRPSSDLTFNSKKPPAPTVFRWPARARSSQRITDYVTRCPRQSPACPTRKRSRALLKDSAERHREHPVSHRFPCKTERNLHSPPNKI